MLARLYKKIVTNSIRSFLIIGILLVSIIQWSCAMQHQEVTPELRTQFMQDLKEGKLNLTCGVDCGLSFTLNLRQMMAMLNSSQYTELAIMVMKIGYKQDFSYYLLGMAAQGLGYNEAALKYFNYSWTLYNDPTPFIHCRDDSTGDIILCGELGSPIDLGTRLPEVILDAQARLENEKKPFGYLTKWEGKDPVRNGLLSDPKFNDSLEATLGKQRAKQLLTGWGRGEPVASEVARVDDNMVFGACKPNDQCYHQAIIFISMIDGTVEACWQDAASSKSLSDFWLSPGGKPRKLHAGYCEMHDDTDLSKMFRDNTSDKRKR